jgi:hypothetical protein
MAADPNRTLPKHLRFSLAQKLDNLCLEILELIVETIYSSSKRELLQKINLKLDVLRSLIQLSHRLKLLAVTSMNTSAGNSWNAERWWGAG